MIRSAPFPVTIDELDVETLSIAVDAPVEGFTYERIGADRGMLGDIFLVQLDYAAGSRGPDNGGPDTVVCKFAAMREGALASARRGGTHERELRCYDELLADLDVSTPRYYGSWYDPDTAHFLLVQAAIAGDDSVDQVRGITPEQVALVASEAVCFHHRYWDDATLAQLDWLPALDDSRRITNLTALATNGWTPLCDLLGDELTAEERSLGDEFPERLETALVALAAMPSTLIHSDLRPDNLLFSSTGSSVALIDWQGAGTGPASFDLAYLISQSLTVEDRRSHEAALIEGYQQQLAQAGTAVSHDEFMAGYRLALHFGLVIACAMPLIADPGEARVRALAHAMARRSIEALRDHGQLWI